MGLYSGEVILDDNQLVYRDLLTFHTRTFKGAKIEYSIKRGDLVETGDIYLSFDRFSMTKKITTISHFDDTGVRFCASIDEDFIRLRYTSTSIGIIPIFKFNTVYYTL